MPSAVVGQVTVRERVVISPVDSQHASFAASLTTSDTLIVPIDGILIVRYDSAKALDSEIGSNAELVVTRNGQSFATDQVSSRLGPSVQSTYFCSDPEIILGDWFLYYPGVGQVSKMGQLQSQDSLWTVGQVLGGDKVAFDYDGKRAGFTYLTGAQSDSTWLGGALGCSDPPRFYFEDAVWLTVMIQPDTVSLHFSPTREIFVPVPDSLIKVTATITVPADSVRFELANDTSVYVAPDTTFTFEDGTTNARSVVVQNGEASLNIKSSAYWGVADIVATAWLSGQPIASDAERFPKDVDLDGIADSWEELYGGLAPPDTFGVKDSLDGSWDWEYNSPFTKKNAGDGIPKMAEYQGVLIGSQHVRLRPDTHEVFIDTTQALYGTWASGEVAAQLKIHVRNVGSVFSPNNSTPGPRKLKWLGDAAARGEWYRGYVLIRDDSVEFSNPGTTLEHERNGEIFSGLGLYYRGSVDASQCSPARACGVSAAFGREIKFGQTRQPWLVHLGSSAYKHGAPVTANVYDVTIDNLWDVLMNAINEASIHTFFHPVPVVLATVVQQYNPKSGNEWYTSEFTGGGSSSVNPFDLLSPDGHANDSLDLKIAGWTQDDFQRHTTLHEVGHALGIPHSGPTVVGVMRSGPGPGTSNVFDGVEIGRVRLRW